MPKPVYTFFVVFLMLCSRSGAQAPADSPVAKRDPVPAVNIVQPPMTVILRESRFLDLGAAPVSQPEVRKKAPDMNEAMFYYLAGVALFLAMIKTLFGHYFANLYRLFFNLTIKQNQLREQLMQAGLPPLLFKFFYMLVFGLLVFFITRYFGAEAPVGEPEWLLVCTGAVMFIYVFKNLWLSFLGWLLGRRQEAELYGFVVSLFNKAAAVVLLPVLGLIAFSKGPTLQAAVTVALAIFGISLFMRYVRGFSTVRGRMPISAFHFLLYIVLLEILPLAVIAKFTFEKFGGKV